MKIEESLVRQIKVLDIPRLDPVTIIVEDISYGKANVTIKCFDKSWTSYWGAMGGTVKDFFSRCNVDYLVNCFDRGISPTTDDKDIYEMEKVFQTKIKELVLEKRKHGGLSRSWARYCWQGTEAIDFESICPEYDHESFNWDLEHFSVDCVMLRELFGYVGCDSEYYLDGFEQWLWDNVPFIYERNHEYYYLCRIVEVVKKF